MLNIYKLLLLKTTLKTDYGNNLILTPLLFFLRLLQCFAGDRGGILKN